MVWEIEDQMPLEEFDSWIAWFKLKQETQKRELDKARQEQRSKSSARPIGRSRRRG